MVISFAVNQGAPIETASGVPLESRGVVDHGCELSGRGRKSHRTRISKSKSKKERKSKRHQKKANKHRSGKSRRLHLNRTLKRKSSRRVDYEQEGGGASYGQLLKANPFYGDAIGSQGAMRAEVTAVKTD